MENVALAPPLGEPLPYASLEDVRLVSLVPLFADVEQLVPTRWVQVLARQGKATLDNCTIAWQAPMVPELEGQAHEIVPLALGTEPYGRIIRSAVGIPATKIDHLFSVDLDGDGTPEVLFSGQYRSRPSQDLIRLYSKFGDVPRWATTSVVGVVSERQRKVLVLARGEDQPAEAGVSLLGMTDVEGDGRLELVVRSRGDHWARFTFVGFSASVAVSRIDTSLSW